MKEVEKEEQYQELEERLLEEVESRDEFGFCVIHWN